MRTTKTTSTMVLLVIATFILCSYDLPTGWFKAGSEPGSYDMGIDSGSGQDGKNAATIKSSKKRIKGFGTLMQNCIPEKYLGKKVRMSGDVRSKDVQNWAGLWLRIDQRNSRQSLAFDNMSDRAITGTTNWKKYEIVLEVPSTASNMAYGALLNGNGQIWFDNVQFEIVDDAVPVTGRKNKDLSPAKEPVNLDFEH